MELRDYFKIIKRHFAVFVVMVILATVFAFGFTKLRPTTYTASTTFTVNKTSTLNQSKVNYYLFDNYYNIQSAGLYSQIVSLWFESPSLIKEVYQKAGIPLPNISQNALGKTFKAVQEEPAVINVSISGKDQDQLNKLMNASYEVLSTKTNDLGKEDTAFFDLTKFDTIVTQDKPNMVLNVIIGLIAGILLGALVALAVAYFKEEKN